MPRLELPDVPESLYQKLQQRAAQSGRSVDAEALACIEQTLDTEMPADRAAVLADIRQFRAKLKGIFLREEDLKAAKEEGRA